MVRQRQLFRRISEKNNLEKIELSIFFLVPPLKKVFPAPVYTYTK